jgi:T5SS/PEP-CTERM-associated repeat protein
MRRGIIMSRRLPAISLALAILTSVTVAVDGVHGQTTWQAGTGDWFAPANWTLGVPNAGSATAFDAIISNGGTAQIQGPGGSVRRLRPGVTGAGHLFIDGGELTVTENLHVNEGVAGNSTITVAGGSVVSSPSTIVGFNSSSNSSFLIADPGTVVTAATQFIVGNLGAGTGTLTIESGGVLNSGVGAIAGGGNPTGAPGVAIVRDPGSRWATTGNLLVGNPGVGALTIENGGTVHVGATLSINNSSNVTLNGGALRFNTGFGLNRLTYTAGTIQLAGNRTLDSDATVTFLYGPGLAPPASITIPTGKALHVEGNSSQFQNNRTVTINGGSLSSTNHTIGLFASGGGFLVVNSGGTMTTSANATLGDVSGSFGTATVSGAGSSWNIGGSAVIGASGNDGVGTLSIQDQSLVYVGTALSINNFSTVTVQGGTLRFNTISGLNRLTYTSGTIQLAGDRGVGTDATITTLYGAFPTVPVGKGLTVEGVATLTKPLTIAGGAFKTMSLAVGAGGSLNFDHGLLELAGGDVSGLANLIIPANGEFRASSAQTTRITAAAGSTITATGDLTLGDGHRHVGPWLQPGDRDVGQRRLRGATGD